MWIPSRHTLVLRGLVAMAFGFMLLVWPTISLQVLVLLFGAFALVDGWLIITAAVLSPEQPGRVAALVAGMLAIVLGVATLVWPGLTQFALLVLVAARALVIGVVDVATAVYLCRESRNRGMWWLLGGIGVFSIAFACLLLAYPAAALVALVRLVGVYAALVGLALIVRAWVLTIALEAV